MNQDPQLQCGIPQAKMTIRQAARWAESKGILYAVRGGQPVDICALYNTAGSLVECIGSHEKCQAYRKALGSDFDSMVTRDGRWLRLEALDTVLAEINEEEGEARCLPDAWEHREWA
jgi:hypothetical protein